MCREDISLVVCLSHLNNEPWVEDLISFLNVSHMGQQIKLGSVVVFICDGDDQGHDCCTTLGRIIRGQQLESNLFVLFVVDTGSASRGETAPNSNVTCSLIHDKPKLTKEQQQTNTCISFLLAKNVKLKQ